MRKITRWLASRFYRPVVTKWLSRERRYSSHGLQIDVHPQVFHPGFFFSTRLLLRYLDSLPVAGKSFLELGAGSGLIAFAAEKRGALVTATDINPFALEYLEKNRLANHSGLRLVASDLFDALGSEVFDIIAINPPYYRKTPVTPADHAWNCGENGEYFEKLFAGLGSHVHPGSIVLMILCSGCDLEMIHQLAEKHEFWLNCVKKHRNWLEDNYIFRVERLV